MRSGEKDHRVRTRRAAVVAGVSYLRCFGGHGSS